MSNSWTSKSRHRAWSMLLSHPAGLEQEQIPTAIFHGREMSEIHHYQNGAIPSFEGRAELHLESQFPPHRIGGTHFDSCSQSFGFRTGDPERGRSCGKS